MTVLEKTSFLGFPVTLCCAALIPICLKYIDKRIAIIGAFVVCMVKPVFIFLFGDGLSTNFVIALIIISKAGMALQAAAIYAWIPECVDWTNYKDGAASAGLVNASVTFTMKLGRALGQSAAGGFMGMAGFTAGASVTKEVVYLHGADSAFPDFTGESGGNQSLSGRTRPEKNGKPVLIIHTKKDAAGPVKGRRHLLFGFQSA